MNDRLLPLNRRPIVIADDQLQTGAMSTRVSGDDPEALLRQFLKLIRRARSASRHHKIALRRSDIEALAEHLGWTDDQVLARLADLMGSSRRQRATMLALLATGASLITISQPTAASERAHDASWPAETPIVVAAPDDFYDGYEADPSTTTSRSEDEAAPAPGTKRAPRTGAVADAQGQADKGLVGVAPTSPSAGSSEGAPGAARAPIESVESPVNAPPPPTVDESNDDAASPPATDAAGNQVAVGQPPVPPATDADGNQVEVGQPPIPPATDADGNQVAVGQPPVPPPTDA